MEIRADMLERQSCICARNALQVFLHGFVSSCRDTEVFIYSTKKKNSEAKYVGFS